MEKKLLLIAMFLWSAMLIRAQEFPIATGSYSQTYPSAAFGNGAYFDVFLDKSSGSSAYGFHGKFIAPDGTVEPGEPVVVPPINSLSFMHEIIRGGSNYIFVWSRGRSSGFTRDAYIQIVNPDGSPQGAMLRVSLGNTETASFVEAAFDGENYLVVWQEGLPNNGSVITGQFVSQDGQLVGSNFDIRPESLGIDVDQIYPDVEFDGEKYLVVWDDDRAGNRDIYGQFVDTGGNLLGNDIPITTNTTDQLLVQLAFGGQNFYAVWSDSRLSSNDRGIFGQLIDTDGSLIGENLPISPPANSEGRTWPDVAASSGEYLVVWDQEWLEYKNTTDGGQEPENLKYEAAGIALPKPIVWYDIYARKIAFDGTFASEEMPVSTAEYHQQDCDVISDGTDFLVSWSDSRNNNAYYDIYGYIVEGSAVPMMPELSPEEIEFTTLQQIENGGEEFDVINPNDFEIAIDTMWFIQDVNRFWFFPGEPPQFPVMIPANGQVQFTVNLLLPAGGLHLRDFYTDTLVVESMGGQLDLLLKLDEALSDTLFNAKMDFTRDSVFFQTVDQALAGETVGLINRHLPQIYIEDAYFSSLEVPWLISTEFPLPFSIFFSDTLDVMIYASAPLKQLAFSDELAVDTLWFDSYEEKQYAFPVYYYTEVIDTIWTGTGRTGADKYLNIHPNPAQHGAYIKMPSDRTLPRKVEILSLNGMVVKTIELSGKSGVQEGLWIDLRGISNGVYLVRLIADGWIKNEKLLISK